MHFLLIAGEEMRLREVCRATELVGACARGRAWLQLTISFPHGFSSSQNLWSQNSDYPYFCLLPESLEVYLLEAF